MSLWLVTLWPSFSSCSPRPVSDQPGRRSQPPADPEPGHQRDACAGTSGPRLEPSLRAVVRIPPDRRAVISGRETTHLYAERRVGAARNRFQSQPVGPRAPHRDAAARQSTHVRSTVTSSCRRCRFARASTVVTIEFDAGDAPLNRNDDFLYTILVPARAHEAFPVLRSAGSQGALDAGARRAGRLGNGRQRRRDITRSARRPDARLTFAETQPISTYLFAFAAGRFSVERAERDGRAMRMFHRETDATKVASNRDAIFDLHAAALNWMERTPRYPTRSASSISCSFRHFSSAAWNTPARSSTTPPA